MGKMQNEIKSVRNNFGGINVQLSEMKAIPGQIAVLEASQDGCCPAVGELGSSINGSGLRQHKVGRTLDVGRWQEPDQTMKEEIQLLQTIVAEMAAKDQTFREEMQQLQNKMAAKERKIQALEQNIQPVESRTYIERCESGVLQTLDATFSTGFGERYLDMTATFSRAFRTTPVVTVGLDSLDDDWRTNLRVTAKVLSKSTTDLTVRIGTWYNSLLYRVDIHWMACA
ncbi:Hypp2928 [Branchiostoma lanceolatum]|nr:Hypp2928 [Branchiostoma lanceolatum]